MDGWMIVWMISGIVMVLAGILKLGRNYGVNMYIKGYNDAKEGKKPECTSNDIIS